MKKRNYETLIVLLCSVTYFISYITRINYGSVILEIVRDKAITNTAASMAVTGSFITYGAGQLISGYMGDRINPVKLVFGGLIITVFMNFLMPLCQNITLMTAIWCINGFAQAFMWPPMVKYLTNTLSNEEYQKACVKVSWGSSAGTIAVYLLSPLCVKFLTWEYVFFISGGLALAMAFIWYFGADFLEKQTKTLTKKNINQSEGEKINLIWNPGFTAMMILIMTAIVLQGALRDGITTWMPTYISQTYNLSSSISILTGVILPIFSIIVFWLVSIIYRKKLKNEQTCAGVMFGIGCGAAIFLLCVSGNNPAASVILSALVCACMHGVNLILICMIPSKFRKYGKVSFISGLLNSCTYIGSAISAYSAAALADNFGWNSVILSWAVFAGTGFIICFALKNAWKKFLEK